jgi:hypothetical protein
MVTSREPARAENALSVVITIALLVEPAELIRGKVERS